MCIPPIPYQRPHHAVWWTKLVLGLSRNHIIPCPIIFLNTNTNYMNLYGCMTNYIILFHENRWRCSTISSPALLRWRQNLTKAHGGSLTYALHCMLTGCYRLRATAAQSPAKEDQPKDKSFTIYDNGSKSSLTWP